MLRPDHAEGRPFLVFDTEREYRDHLGEVLGNRIGREQRKLEDALEQIAELEAELAALRREGIGRGTPLRPD
jgi:succinate dehydrogenase/fumarate reductase flavoprotein subunit